ncbi:MAG: hypothetical protein HYY96_09365 [Candidatus Tectomicrobia bacterium]|nr:hypothetical protein [Candidatus Tectomicrobia bacterium]
MITITLSFLMAAALSLSLTPLARRWAVRLGVFDYPGGRKLHAKPIPLLGGVSVFLAFSLTVALATGAGLLAPKQHLVRALLLVAPSLFLLGVIDDLRGVSARAKLLVQGLAALSLTLLGWRIRTLGVPFLAETIELGWLSIPITILWVVGITNAFNLIDGLDGLATGAAFIVALSIGGIAFMNQDTALLLVAAILAGAAIGFLRYNFNPASIFLGDSGSLFLGFVVSTITIEGSLRSATIVSILTPILCLGIPLTDTLLSMVRRFLKATHLLDLSRQGKLRVLFYGSKSMFEADRDHIHHRLLKLGLSHRRTVLSLYAVSLALCVSAFASVAWKNLNAGFLLATVVLATCIGLHRLGYLHLPGRAAERVSRIYALPIIERRLVQLGADVLFIALAFWLALSLRYGWAERHLLLDLLRTGLPVILFVQLCVFYLGGLYRSVWRYSSVHELLKLTRVVALATFFAAALLFTLYDLPTLPISVFLSDFLFLVLLCGGFRLSFRIAAGAQPSRAAREPAQAEQRHGMLIYGAGWRGAQLLHELHHHRRAEWEIRGFIDDDPKKQGFSLHGYPVVCTSKTLAAFLDQRPVSQIVLSTPRVNGGQLEEVEKLCTARGILLSEFVLDLRNVSYPWGGEGTKEQYQPTSRPASRPLGPPVGVAANGSPAVRAAFPAPGELLRREAALARPGVDRARPREATQPRERAE